MGAPANEHPAGQDYRTIWLSDIPSRARAVARPNSCSISCATTRAMTIYLVGDIVDGWQMRRSWYWPQAAQ